jgi:uncharacterized membrane protein HdeD (DUF308 family)
MDFINALTFLVAGGSVLVVSWVAEQITAFQALASNTKKWLFFGVSTVLSVGAYLVLHDVSTTVLTSLTPYFVIVSGIFTTLFISDKFHVETKA